MTIETIRFANDTQTRKRLMVPESFQHPAKGQLGMWATMIERYSQPGDTVLDPMSGSGATLLAALMGRNVICVELEQHFVEPMRRSWAKMRTMPMLGHEMGQATILQGDARSLSELLGLENPVLEQNPDLGVDVVISSPPYEGSITGDTAEATRKRIAEGKYHGLRPDVFTSPGNVAGSSYGDGYTRPVDAIVTSPPFQDQEATKAGKFADPVKSAQIQSANYRSGASKGHFASPEAILRAMDAQRPYAPDNPTNIGNLRNTAYWDAMRQVYTECWRVLKPGGIMALVLKGFTRDGKYVDLPGQTEALLLEAGWQKHDHWRRELWSLSFWRILQKRRDPAAWDDRLMYEEVLAFKKPGGEGNGVDAVITSPPYEGTESNPYFLWPYVAVGTATKLHPQGADMSQPRLLDTFCKAGGATKGYQMAGFEVIGVDIEPQPHYCGDAFIQADALDVLYALAHGDCWPDQSGRDWHLEDFDAIHASPPCQGYSIMRNLPWLRHKEYPLLIQPTKELLEQTGRPWVIENVMGAHLEAGWLCGLMFGLPFYRHRVFESSVFWLQPEHPRHEFVLKRGPHFGSNGGRLTQVVFSDAEDARGKQSWPGRREEGGHGLTITHSLATVQGNGAQNNGVGIGHAKGWRLAAETMGIDWMNRAELSQAIPPIYTEFVGRQLLAALRTKETKLYGDQT